MANIKVALRNALLPSLALLVSTTVLAKLQINKLGESTYLTEQHGTFTAIQNIGQARVLSSVGLQGLSSSKLWLDFVQYMGGEEGKNQGFQHSPMLLKQVTSLEPRFLRPYTFVVSALGIRAGDPETGREILEHGTNHITPDWNDQSFRLPFQLALLNFLFLGDEEGGRDAYYLAADRYEQSYGVSASVWRDLGDSLYQNPRSERAQFNMWRLVYSTTFDEEVKQRAYERLSQLGTVETMPDGTINLIPPEG